MSSAEQRGVNLAIETVFAQVTTDGAGAITLGASGGILGVAIQALGIMRLTLADPRASLVYGGVATALLAGVPGAANVAPGTNTFDVTVIDQAGALVDLAAVAVIVDLELSDPS